MARWTVSEALRDLAAIDPVMAGLIERHAPMPTGRVVPSTGRFEVLGRAIAHQQLSGRAAATIWERVRVSVGGVVDPEAVLRSGPEALRACGLSVAKAASMVDLALATLDGRLDLTTLGRRFRPWRSVVAWYCWRATEEPVQRSTATPSGK